MKITDHELDSLIKNVEELKCSKPDLAAGWNNQAVAQGNSGQYSGAGDPATGDARSTRMTPDSSIIAGSSQFNVGCYKEFASYDRGLLHAELHRGVDPPREHALCPPSLD